MMTTEQSDFEQQVLDLFYRTERRYGRAAVWLSSAGAILGIVSGEHRGLAITLLGMSIGGQLLSWRAMRGAQRLEDKRIARLNGQHAERWKGQP